MAILSKLDEFADEQAVTNGGSTGTLLLPNQIDLLAAGYELGGPGAPYLVIQVGATEIITGGSAGTLTFRLVSDDSATIDNTTCSVHLVTKAFVTDDAAANETDAGKVLICVQLPMSEVERYERYLGVQAIIGSTVITAGTVNAYLTMSPPSQPKSYPDASN